MWLCVLKLIMQSVSEITFSFVPEVKKKGMLLENLIMICIKTAAYFHRDLPGGLQNLKCGFWFKLTFALV